MGLISKNYSPKQSYTLSDQCHLIKNSEHMKTLCRPLMEQTDINFFGYSRLYKGGEFLLLSNYVEWGKASYEYGLMSDFQHIKMLLDGGFCNECEGTRYLTVSHANKELDVLSKAFNLNDIITLCEDRGDYIEALIFGSRENKVLLPFYSAHWDVLIKFKYYYMDAAAKLVAQSDKDRILLPRREHEITFDKEVMSPLDLQALSLDESVLVRYLGKEVLLSRKYAMYLKDYALKVPRKKTSLQMGCSVDEVKNRLTDLQKMFGLTCRSELREVYYHPDSSLSEFE